MNPRKKLAVLTGAGISAESGLKTFRDSDGLWMGYNIEDVATPRAFQRNPQLVLDFYNMRRKDVAASQPNEAHYGLVELEKNFEVTVITQNIDDLHERAGSSNVMHLHGEIFKKFSVKNKDVWKDVRGDINLGDVCASGGQYRPAIVWFEEPVPMIEKAISTVMQSEIIVVIGTSLQVYPAASLLHYATPDIPLYILDKKIPDVGRLRNITKIEKPATEGIKDLLQILMA